MPCFVCGSELSPYRISLEDRELSCCEEHRYYADLARVALSSGHTMQDVLLFIDDINIMFMEAIQDIQDCIGTENEQEYDIPNLRVMRRLHSLAFVSPALLQNLFKAYLDI